MKFIGKPLDKILHRTGKVKNQEQIHESEEVNLREVFSICRRQEDIESDKFLVITPDKLKFINEIKTAPFKIDRLFREIQMLRKILSSNYELSFSEIFKAEQCRRGIDSQRDVLTRLFQISREEAVTITKYLNSLEFQIQRNEDEMKRLNKLHSMGVINNDEYSSGVGKSRSHVKKLKSNKSLIRKGLRELSRNFSGII